VILTVIDPIPKRIKRSGNHSDAAVGIAK
jgi:hypothetical protein